MRCFDTDFYQHARDIYDEPRWPDEPLFYANFPSLTDKTAAPEGMESLSFSAISSGINDTIEKEYFDKIMNRFESLQSKVSKKILYLKVIL
jgi:phytoene desaturase